MKGDAPADSLVITDGTVAAHIAPEIGAGLLRFDHVARGKAVPLFRPADPVPPASPFHMASILLLPWSNRISRGGFALGGRWHGLEPSLPGQAYPLHGNGFLQPWQVTGQSAATVELHLSSPGPGPYRYEAWMHYGVGDGALEMRLRVVNLADHELPYGLGFHPWLVRTDQVLLEAPARHVWLEDADHLPLGVAPVAIPPHWDFAEATLLPAGFINNCFEQWTGTARVQWGDRGLAMDITAAPPLNRYLLYSPGVKADFFCFEPVSHAVDAHNLGGGMAKHGLCLLRHGEELAVATRFAITEAPR